jgi:hypothetical protein
MPGEASPLLGGRGTIDARHPPPDSHDLPDRVERSRVFQSRENRTCRRATDSRIRTRTSPASAGRASRASWAHRNTRARNHTARTVRARRPRSLPSPRSDAGQPSASEQPSPWGQPSSPQPSPWGQPPSAQSSPWGQPPSGQPSPAAPQPYGAAQQQTPYGAPQQPAAQQGSPYGGSPNFGTAPNGYPGSPAYPGAPANPAYPAAPGAGITQPIPNHSLIRKLGIALLALVAVAFLARAGIDLVRIISADSLSRSASINMGDEGSGLLMGAGLGSLFFVIVNTLASIAIIVIGIIAIVQARGRARVGAIVVVAMVLVSIVLSWIVNFIGGAVIGASGGYDTYSGTFSAGGYRILAVIDFLRVVICIAAMGTGAFLVFKGGQPKATVDAQRTV